MIKHSDINNHGYDESDEVRLSIDVLVSRLNELLKLGCPITSITSGLRSAADQARINPAAPKSKHLTGHAADCYDPKGRIATWCRANLDKLATIGLWCEDFDHTPTWVHFQSEAPRSGKRVFLP